MKSETSCGVLCQHPECWRANLRRVKEAVRARNGIKSTEAEEEKVSGSVIERKKDLEDGSLPTLKVINLFEGSNQRTGSAPDNSPLQPSRFHYRSSSLPSLSPDQSLPQPTSCTPTFSAPRPSPATPTMVTDYQKRMQWKKRVQAVEESNDKRCGSGHLSIVGVHEMYDDEEWSQDWRDVYITSAYLIWCQTNKRKRRKAKSTGSLASRKDPRKVAFKDVTEEMIPAVMEKLKPKRPEPRRSPTVGQPFSPSRLSSHKKVHIQHLDLAVYGLDELKDFPTSVLAGIIQHLKPKDVTGDQDLPLGLDLRLKQQSSVRSTEHGTNHRKGTYTTNDVTGKKLEQTLRDESSRVLLDIDINSHLTSPEEEEEITTEGRGAEEWCNPKDDERLAKRERSLGNAVDQSLVTKQGRVTLPLASVGVPTDHARKSKLHHCTNSIPRKQQLGIAMEPVDLVPATATPTPTGTPAEQGSVPGFQLCTQPHSSLEDNLASEHALPTDDRLNRYWPVRGHITSALRHSPFPVRAPAPTPISPEKWGRYSRSSHTRERTSESPRRLKRWETLSNVYDRQETGEEIACVPRGSPEGEAEDISVEPVFLTEGVLPQDPSLSPSSTRKAVGEWPQNKMIINVIENLDEDSHTIRSPSPGSKTCIPQDILAEFQGDLYGRKQIRVAGQKISGKPNVVTQPQISTEYPGYIAAGLRPPRSRTPLQFLETPSRKAPKPLRQPPSDSMPKSLTVQPLSTGVRRRPKSTPPRLTSPRDGAVQQVLSDSSLVSGTRDDLVALSMVAHAPSPSTDRGGSIPPPPSPEVPHSLQNGAVSSRLDPVSEAEERSGVAHEAGEARDGAPTANLSDVEEENEEEETAVHLEDNSEAEFSNESKDVAFNEKEFQATASERQPRSLISGQEVFSTTNEWPVANGEELTLNENTRSDRDTDPQTQAHGETTETKQGFKEVGLEEGVSTALAGDKFAENNEEPEESRDIETAEPPQPPGSPDLVDTPDFTEGVDLSLDLEAELRAAMEGLDDMGDLGGTGERRPSPELND